MFRLEWKLSTITCSTFINLLLSFGSVYPDDTINSRKINISDIAAYEKYVRAFGELCTKSFQFQKYPNSFLAICIIICSRKIIKLDTFWRDELSIISGYTFSECENIVNEICVNFSESYPKGSNCKSPDSIKCV